MSLFKTTKQHKEFWKSRRIDWKTAYLDTWQHPHREMLVQALHTFRWRSIWEIGVGAGENLVRILRSYPPETFKTMQMGGSDINADAIALAQKVIVGGYFRVESVEEMLMSDKSVDIMLSDATLIYIDPFKINAVMKDLFRITRDRILLCEFHSDNLWKRWWFRFKTGYNAYDYKRLLEKYGAYDIQMVKIPPQMWPGCQKGDGWYDFGYVILAKLPK